MTEWREGFRQDGGRAPHRVTWGLLSSTLRLILAPIRLVSFVLLLFAQPLVAELLRTVGSLLLVVLALFYLLNLAHPLHFPFVFTIFLTIACFVAPHAYQLLLRVLAPRD
jgi:hypothetical protein